MKRKRSYEGLTLSALDVQVESTILSASVASNAKVRSVGQVVDEVDFTKSGESDEDFLDWKTSFE